MEVIEVYLWTLSLLMSASALCLTIIIWLQNRAEIRELRKLAREIHQSLLKK